MMVLRKGKHSISNRAEFSTFNHIYFFKLVLLMICPSFVLASTPEGFWKTYDLHHTPRSIVKIFKKDDSLVGMITQVFPPQTTQSLCFACKGKWHNKRLIGLPIIWGLKKENEKWVGGKVLDIDSGKIYSCSLTVSKDNKILYFSAYLGTPLFGTTLSWIRYINAKN